MKSNIFGMLVLLIYSSTLYADNSVKENSELWDFTVTPYLWASNLDGTVAMKGLPEKDMDVNFGDILKNLDSGFMGEFEARTDNYGFITDIIYMDVSDSTSLNSIPVTNKFSIDIKQTMISLSFFYNAIKLNRMDVDVFAGARYNHVDQSVAVVMNNHEHTVRHREYWIDPITGVRFSYELTDFLYAESSVDIGGFDIGSKITSQFQGSLNYLVNDRIQYGVGYRIIKTDYEQDDFKYDVVFDGVFLNASYTF